MKEWINSLSDNYIAVFIAIISILSSIITLIFKYIFDSIFLQHKLKSEYKAEQRKKTKDALSKYKMQLINSGESLNYRICNLYTNHKNKWHCMNGNYSNSSDYLHTMVYRFISFFAWINIIERSMIFIDTTVASKLDIQMIKFLKIFKLAFCNHGMFEGLEYDNSIARDHFFKNDFESLALNVISDDRVIEYNEYLDNLPTICDELTPLYKFFDSISIDEKRYRWNVLQEFHFTLIAFLNTYGYDFQFTKGSKIKTIKQYGFNSTVHMNYRKVITRMKLNNQKSFKKIFRTLKKGLV